ncbi:MAG: hypothetical protein HPY53_12525 [Brevinematales bacterium]|nr:hypothetical protein [Brevinematales bacterium]
MKKVYTSIFITLFTVVLFSYTPTFLKLEINLDNPQNILDYFLLLSDEEFIGTKLQLIISELRLGSDYNTLVPEGGVLDKISNIIIDKKNAFIKIFWADEYTSSEITFCYFIKSDNKKIFGFNNIYYTDGYYFHKAKFFLYENGEWVDVSQEILKNLGFSCFWSETKSLPDKKYQEFEIEYILPQYGTTVKAVFHEWDWPLCECDMDMKWWKYYKKVMKQIKYRKIDLLWDKEKGVFTIGKKYTK